jgi:hypothetical protein
MKTRIEWSDLIIEEGKLDPLSLWRVGDRLAGDLLSAFTTVVMHRPARYFAMYSWIFSLLQRRDYKSNKEYWRDFFQYETALICSIYLHEEHNYDSFLGRVGSEYAGELIQSSKNGIVNLSNKKVRNGWEVNYKNSMYDFGLLETDPGLVAGLKLTAEGDALSKAYGETVNRSAYFREYLNEKKVPIRVLKESSAYTCPCVVHNPLTKRLSEERASIANIMLSKGKHNGNAKGALIDSIDLILTFIRAINKKGIGFTEKTWRRALSTGNYAAGETFRVPENYLGIYRKWDLYNLDNLFVFSLESALGGFLEYLHKNNNLRKKELDNKLDLLISTAIKTKREPLLNEKILSNIELVKGLNNSRLFELEEVLIKKIGESNGLRKVLDAFSLCLYIIALYIRRKNSNDYAPALTYFNEVTNIDGYELSLEQAVEAIEGCDCRTYFLDQYIKKWLIQRQLDARIKRNKDVAWFLYAPETGFYSWEANYESSLYRASRTSILMSFLLNINVVQQIDGEWHINAGIELPRGN